MQLDDLLELYTETNPRMRSPESFRRMRSVVRNLERHLGRPATTDDFTPDTYGLWVRSRQESGSHAAGTIRGEAEKYLVLWRWWSARDGVDHPAPNVPLPPPAIVTPVAWTREERERLEAAARSSTRRVGGLPAAIFWPAMLGIAIDTGERIKAIHAVQTGDLDLDRRTVTFRADTRKFQREDSVKPLSPETVRAIRVLLLHRPEGPFAPIKYKSLYTPLRWLLVDAGLPRDRQRMFHCLRRTHATHVHLQGGDATASLGHTSPEVTRRSYIDRSQIPQVLPARAGLWSRLWRRWAG